MPTNHDNIFYRRRPANSARNGPSCGCRWALQVINVYGADPMPAKAKFRPINFEEGPGLASPTRSWQCSPNGPNVAVAQVLCRQANWIIVVLGQSTYASAPTMFRIALNIDYAFPR
jgi:hypothetical protein